MSKLKTSAAAKAQYKAYAVENRHEKNILAKLEKLAKSQPNNKPLLRKLENYLSNGVPYKRSRRSKGHPCKGMYSSLGFVKNQPSDSMIKSGPKINGVTAPLGLHWYHGAEIVNATQPNHGSSMGDQLEAFGFKRKKNYVRKHKKTTR